MTFSEVLVAALVLGISGQVSVSSWSRAAAAAGRGETLQQMLHRSDEHLLVTRRLLSRGSGDRLLAARNACRFNAARLRERLEPLQADASDLITELSIDAAGDGVWLQLTLRQPGDQPPLTRRLYVTPAGLGLCEQGEP